MSSRSTTTSSRILQVSISPGGIPKLPVAEGEVTTEGIRGDSWRNRQYHGGPQQAILLVTSEGLAELTALGFAVYPGALGENLTSAGLDRRALRIGSVLTAGTATFQITKIRMPCATLNPLGDGIQAAIYDKKVKAGDHGSSRWGLSGFYMKVLAPGRVRAGDIIRLDPVSPDPHAQSAGDH